MKKYIKNEFAQVEKIFTYKGRECIVIFNCHGYRCGYVSTNYDADYDKLNDFINVHGGLTYNGTLPYDYGQSEHFFVGFDCGHIGDKEDYLRAYRYGLITKRKYLENIAIQHKYDSDGVVRSAQYVVRECKKLVEQLIQINIQKLIERLNSEV